MIDTISEDFFDVVIRTAVLEDRKELWAFSRTPNNHGGWVIVYRKTVTLGNGATIEYEYYPFASGGKPFLRVTYSLPKVVFGNNYQMVFDIEGAIAAANKLLPQVRGIPYLNLWKGKLVRLDVCYNHQLGHLVPYFVRAMQSLEYDRRRTLPYSSEGVFYGNASITTIFYNKAKELLNDKDDIAAMEAYGILRQETSLRKAYIKKLTGREHPTLRDISLEPLIATLEEDLEKLDLRGNSIGTRDTTFERLSETNDEDTATFLLGWLVRGKDSISRKDLAKASTLSKSTIRRRIADALDTKVPLTLTSYEEALPPLVIDREMILLEEEEQNRKNGNEFRKLPE